MAVAEAAPERARNRLLRRADWRFLLPDPSPGKTICFGRGPLARAVRLISESVVDSVVDPADCDLAVAADPDPSTLGRAWAALGPGGACYTEWYSPLARPAGVRRRLEQAGFENIRCYLPLPWPPLANARVWLPMGADAAIRHFTDRQAPVRGLFHHPGKALLQALWLLTLRFCPSFPVCATAIKPARAGRKPTADRALDVLPMAPGLLGAIMSQHEMLGVSPDRLSSILLTGGPRRTSKVLRLVFAEPDPCPRLALKMARVPESVPGLRREAETLRSIQAARPDGAPGVPRLLFAREDRGLLTVGETALTGPPLFQLLDRPNYRDVALEGTAWLADFAGRPEPAPRDTWWHRLVEPALADFARTFASVLDPGMFRETEEVLGDLGALPTGCEQRDFSPWNIVRTPEGSLAIHDWESAELRGLPALDLIYFLSFLAFFLDGTVDTPRAPKSYRATLQRTTFTGAVASECAHHYSARTGLDVSAVRPLRLLAWLIHSRSDYRSFLADSGGEAPDAKTLAGSLFFRLWEEELRHGTSV